MAAVSSLGPGLPYPTPPGPGPMHQMAGKGPSRKLNRPGYAAWCMSIRSALQAVANLSDGSADLAGSEGKALPRVGAGRPRW